MIHDANLLRNLLIIAGLATSMVPAAESAAKIGGLNAQHTVWETSEGKRAAVELRAHFQADEIRLQNEQVSLEALRDRQKRKHRLAWLPLRHSMLRKESVRLVAEINEKTAALARDTQQVNSQLNRAELIRVRELAQHLLVAIQRFAKDNGYSLILDTSASSRPAGLAPPDVTARVIQRYEELYSRNR